jgi:hypothetical protein
VSEETGPSPQPVRPAWPPPLVGDTLRWLVRNLGMATATGALVAFGTFVLTYGPRLLGWEAPLAPPTGDPARAALFGAAIAVTCAIVSTVIGFWLTAGTKRLIAAIFGFPGAIASLFRADGRAGLAHLMWGAGIALLMAGLVVPTVRTVVATTVLLSVTSLAGAILCSVLYRLWSAAAGLFSPVRKQPLEGAVMMAVGLMGAVLSIAASFLLNGWAQMLTLALGCAVAALLFSLAAARGRGG